MESKLNESVKKFMNNIERNRKITEFKNSIPASFNFIMAIKIRKQRLASLLELSKDANKKISEIEALSTSYKPEGLNEYFGIASPSEESIKWQKEKADIASLREYKIPIDREINKLRVLLSLRKDPVKKSIEEQYIKIYKSASNVDKVDLLLKSQAYIDSEGRWIGKTDIKGELKACFQILKEMDILWPGKATTQYRIIYQRFKYVGSYAERTLRNDINDPAILKGFRTLFTPLLKDKY